MKLFMLIGIENFKQQSILGIFSKKEYAEEKKSYLSADKDWDYDRYEIRQIILDEFDPWGMV
jgi:hypothetical protein